MTTLVQQASLDSWHPSLWSLELSSVFNDGQIETVMGGDRIFLSTLGKKVGNSAF